MNSLNYLLLFLRKNFSFLIAAWQIFSSLCSVLFTTVCIPISFRAEKEEVQLNNGHPVAQIPQKNQIEPKPAFIKRTAAKPAQAAKTVRVQSAAFSVHRQNQSQSNKKSLVVNGNGHKVRTSISRDSIEQNGLHL